MSKEKGLMYMPTTLEKSEMANLPPETGAGAGFHDMTDEDILDEI